MRLKRYLALAAVLVVGCGTALAATAPVTGLGQSWPNAPDQSTSPQFHVYTFDRKGVRYIQVNDTNGTVRGAIAVIGDEVMALPMGTDATRWSASTLSTARAAGPSVYQDAAVRVSATPLPDGSLRLLLAPSQCEDPAKCSIKGP
ncbi:hypothetical protein [Luteibacter sp. 9135]|uniref:hypothetical protein n=1 Tax=Luteibacter sp. 9135 TaxID=1500893 RepID=UPI00068E4321|nr:hypothetical protein [Luteibacter sp. 9135]